MTIKFKMLTRANQRNLLRGQRLVEHGIEFDRLACNKPLDKINELDVENR